MSYRSEASARLKKGEFELLRFLWCDNANVIRTKSVFLPPLLARAGDNAEAIVDELDDAVTGTAALQALCVVDHMASVPGLEPAHDIRVVPDWETFGPSASDPAIASVACTLVDGMQPWLHCPRHFLARMQQELGAEGLEAEAGFEVEFFLLKPGADPNAMPIPVDHGNFASSVAADKSHAVIGDILHSLWEQGVPIEQYSAEAGPGQQEISIEHCPPLQLADRLIRVRETVRAVARMHGLVASFVPLLFENATGSGMHTHLSLWKEGKNELAGQKDSKELSQVGNAFMAGVLHHLPALMAVTTPSVNSYRRIRPHAWSGAYQAWGIANKEAAVRLIVDPRTGSPAHFEIKTIDGSANPYLALGNILAAGLDGIRTKLALPHPVEIDPGNYTARQREERKIKALPTNLEASLEYFVADEALRTAMGEKYAEAFAAVRRTELDALHGMAFEEERLVLLERY